jgi:carbonic anhydrase/acetyltransferase-like protein (isoleucine patch superfamily)
VLPPGPDVSIGEGCVIGNGVRLSNCVVMKGVKVKDHSKVRQRCDARVFGMKTCAWRCTDFKQLARTLRVGGLMMVGWMPVLSAEVDEGGAPTNLALVCCCCHGAAG